MAMNPVTPNERRDHHRRLQQVEIDIGKRLDVRHYTPGELRDLAQALRNIVEARQNS